MGHCYVHFAFVFTLTPLLVLRACGHRLATYAVAQRTIVVVRRHDVIVSNCIDAVAQKTSFARRNYFSMHTAIDLHNIFAYARA